MTSLNEERNMMNEKRNPMMLTMTLKLLFTYTRYVLSVLATIGFEDSKQ